VDNARLESVLASPRLPSLPSVAIRIIELVREPNVTVTELADAIAVDPALASKILRTANSPLYAQSKRISRLRDAVMRLGLRTVKALALGFSLVDQLKAGAESGFDHRTFWERSIYTATAARSLAARSNEVEAEEAFLGGLVHGLGILAANQALGQRYASIYAAAGDDPVRLLQMEREAFGFDHVTVGTALADRWNLPPALAACLRYVYEPESAPPGERPAVRIVAAGRRVAEVFTSADNTDALEMYRLACQSWFRMSSELADQMLEEIDTEARVICSVLDLPGGSTVTAGEILARANEALSQISLESELDNVRLEREREQLSTEASTDSLTGLANRRGFDLALSQQLRLAHRYGLRMSLAFIDLDRFKLINDMYGHQAGDEVLRQTAQVISESVRSTDIVARYGGEEFAVIMPNTPLGGAASLANRVRAALEAHVVEFEGRDIFVTMSVGVATYDPRTPATESDMVAAADGALYDAKQAGRNAVRLGRVRAVFAA
jgi:diguanylate cyclase (GGDEF)-like protein